MRPRDRRHVAGGARRPLRAALGWVARAKRGPLWSPWLGCFSILAASLVQGDSAPRASTAADVVRAAVKILEHDRDRERAFDATYAYTRVRTLEVRDGDGDLKRREIKRLENQPDALSHGVAEGEEEPDGKTRERKGKPYQRHDFQVDDELLDRFRFELVGKELINERPAWVIEFAPRRGGLPGKSIKDRFINQTAGRVWIDEAEHAMVRAQLRLLEPVNVVGGLVGVVKKCETAFERVRTLEGWWFTQIFRWRLEGRQLFQQRVMDFHEERSEVRMAP